MKSLATVSAEIKAARIGAERDARAIYKFVRSRGVEYWIEHAEQPYIDEKDYCRKTYPTAREFKDVMNEAMELARNHTGVKVWFAGGFNGSDSLRDLNADMYDPWVSEWQVLAFDAELMHS